MNRRYEEGARTTSQTNIFDSLLPLLRFLSLSLFTFNRLENISVLRMRKFRNSVNVTYRLLRANHKRSLESLVKDEYLNILIEVVVAAAAGKCFNLNVICGAVGRYYSTRHESIERNCLHFVCRALTIFVSLLSIYLKWNFRRRPLCEFQRKMFIEDATKRESEKSKQQNNLEFFDYFRYVWFIFRSECVRILSLPQRS